MIGVLSMKRYLGLLLVCLLLAVSCAAAAEELPALQTPVDADRAKQLTKRAKERGWDKTMAPTVKVSRRGEVTARFERKTRRSPAKPEENA